MYLRMYCIYNVYTFILDEHSTSSTVNETHGKKNLGLLELYKQKRCLQLYLHWATISIIDVQTHMRRVRDK